MATRDEEGGAGLHRGGKGVRIDYRMRSDNAWLTVAYTRSKVLPWPLKGGYEGSRNHVEIVRSNGSIEDYSVVSGLTVNKGEIIRVLTATGAGWGDPMRRDLELVKDDVKNGYITLEQAEKYYGVVLDPETLAVKTLLGKRKALAGV
jgi:N-methylhydantoinase B